MEKHTDTTNKDNRKQEHFTSAREVVSKWAEWKKEYANCNYTDIKTQSKKEER